MSIIATVSAFVNPTQTQRHATKLNLMDASSFEQSRAAFFVWFFGGSGAAGIALGAFPRMYQQAKDTQKLADQQSTENQGEMLSVLGFPPVPLKDVAAVVNNRLSVEQIIDRYPIKGNFLSARGYLVFEAFAEANSKENPLAVRAVFDSFATSTNVVEPDKAQELLDFYKIDILNFKQKLSVSKLVGLGSISTVVFLLAFAASVSAENALHGWFPDWPGADNLPWSLFDGSLATIPEYWI